jgi:hypothetical protein
MLDRHPKAEGASVDAKALHLADTLAQEGRDQEAVDTTLVQLGLPDQTAIRATLMETRTNLFGTVATS